MDEQQSSQQLQAAYRTSYLIAGYLKQSLTPAEHAELEAWKAADQSHLRLFQELTDPVNLAAQLQAYGAVDTEAYLEQAKERRNTIIQRVGWRSVLKVAAILLPLLVLTLYVVLREPKQMLPPSTALHQGIDQAPASAAAEILLPNGQRVPVSAIPNDTMIGTVAIGVDSTGFLTYAASAAGESETHTLIVPRNAHYQLVLSDGTRVWLNAGSTLTYPAHFSGDRREVRLTGEGYFEVYSDHSRPFFVRAGTMSVRAVGTAFNVNAYKGDTAIVTTLIEGKVLLETATTPATILQPGQQGTFNNRQVLLSYADTQQVLAWKAGLFRFVHTPLHEVLQELSRWYDVEVVDDPLLTLSFNATINRSLPLSQVLTLLEKTGDVRFRQEGKRLYVVN